VFAWWCSICSSTPDHNVTVRKGGLWLTAKDLAAGAKSSFAIELLKTWGARGFCRKGKFGGWVHWADDWDDDDEEEGEQDEPMREASAQWSASSSSWWAASAPSNTAWEQSRRQNSWCHDAPWRR
jgi:hypothetical protein